MKYVEPATLVKSWGVTGNTSEPPLVSFRCYEHLKMKSRQMKKVNTQNFSFLQNSFRITDVTTDSKLEQLLN